MKESYNKPNIDSIETKEKSAEAEIINLINKFNDLINKYSMRTEYFNVAYSYFDEFIGQDYYEFDFPPLLKEVRESVRKNPKEWVRLVDQIENYVLREDVINEAVSSIGVDNFEEAKNLYKEVHSDYSHDALDHNFRHDIYPKVLDKKFRLNFNDGINFAANWASETAKKKMGDSDGMKELLTMISERQLEPSNDADPELTLKIIDFTIEYIYKYYNEKILNEVDDRLVDSRKRALETQYDLRFKVIRKLKNSNPEKALSLFDDTDKKLLDINEGKKKHEMQWSGTRDMLVELVEKSVIRNEMQNGNWEQAIKLLSVSDSTSGKVKRSGFKYYDISNEFKELIKTLYYDHLIDADGGIDFKEAAKFLRSLPEEVPGSRNLLNDHIESVLTETAYKLRNEMVIPSIKGITYIMKGRFDTKETENMQPYFEAVINQLNQVPEAAALLVYRDTGKVVIKPEKRYEIYNNLLATRGNFSKYNSFRPSDFIGLSISPKELDVLLRQLFDKHIQAIKYDVISQDLDYYVDIIKSLSVTDLDLLVSNMIKHDGLETIVSNLEIFSKMSKNSKDDLFLEIVRNGPINALFNSNDDFGADNIFKILDVNPDEMIPLLIKKEPSIFAEYFKQKIRFFNHKEEGVYLHPALSEQTQHALIKELLKNNVTSLVKIIDVFTVKDYVFDKETVQDGYEQLLLNFFSEGTGSNLSSNFKTLQDFTSIESDFNKLKNVFTEYKLDIDKLFSCISIDVFNKNEFIKIIPWFKSIKKLGKIQERAANQSHDPWVTDLAPLAKQMDATGILSYKESKDGEVFLDFVSTFGSIYAPKLCSVFADLSKIKNLEHISDKSRNLLIDAMGKSRFEKFNEPSEVINELRRQKRNLVSDLLKEKTSQILQSELGLEILSSTIGKGSWSRGDVGVFIDKWKKTQLNEAKRLRDVYEDQGDQGGELLRDITILPEGYKEISISVKKRIRKKSTINESERNLEKTKKLLSKKHLIDSVSQFNEAFSVLEVDDLESNLSEYKGRVLEVLDKKIKQINGRIAVVSNKKAKVQMNDALTKLNDQYKELVELDFSEFVNPILLDEDTGSTDSKKEILLRDLMEKLINLKIKGKDAESLIRAVSAIHIDKVLFDGFRDTISSENISKQLDSVSLKQLERLSVFIRDYLLEHYLQQEQNEDHTGHSGFSDELQKELSKAWGLNNGMEKHPFFSIKNQLSNIGTSKTLSQKEVGVAMVPSQGLMRILSGDTGDACYTSQHDALAQGKYPDLHAYTFVTGRDTPNERFAGSVLFIETKRDNDDKGVLLVRANNPRENLIQNVDANELISKTIEEAIEVAKRRGLDYVAVPLDRATASSSNRSAVSAYYKDNYSDNELIGLTDQPETNFNGYNNHDVQSRYKSVIVWSSAEEK